MERPIIVGGNINVLDRAAPRLLEAPRELADRKRAESVRSRETEPKKEK